MQFTSTVFALVGALAASASAQYGTTAHYGQPSNSTLTPQSSSRYGYGANGTTAAVPAGPTGTGSAGLPGHGGNGTMGSPSSPSPTGYGPDSQWGNGAVGRYAGSGLGLLVAGGIAFAL